MKPFVKTANGFQSLIVFTKSSILDVGLVMKAKDMLFFLHFSDISTVRFCAKSSFIGETFYRVVIKRFRRFCIILIDIMLSK